MPKFLSFCAIGGIVLIAACSSNNGGVDTGDNGAGSTVGGGTGQGNNNGGSANGTSNTGTGSSSANAGTGNSSAGGSGGTVGGSNSAGGSVNTGTGGSTVCGTALCGPTSCGSIADACGNSVDCGYTNCSQAICGTADPNTGVATLNVCPPCTPTDCATAGTNCGQIPDGCGNVLDCGTCADSTQCCGCGTPGVANVCGTGSGPGSGLPYTCIAGTQGCLCDSTGACAPGLTCDTSQSPNLCCSGTNCTAPNGGLTIATCTGTGQASCTPGITIPTASGANDNCGYPSTSFNESQFICGIVAAGGGPDPAEVQAFFNDEMSMTLGCTQNGYTVSPMPSDPATVYYPNTGDPTCNDTSGQPMRPSLFITDITRDPSCTAGDQQKGGTPYDPIAVFGTWKSATNGTPGANPSTFNYWNLGANADPVPTSVSAQCPCVAPPAGVTLPSTTGYNGGNVAQYNNCPGTAHLAKGFSTETRYEVALVSGHSYRLQVIGHDGDQTQGGDSGEGCVTFCAGNGICTPKTCSASDCGPVADGCGGVVQCKACCTPLTCEEVCPVPPGGKAPCSSTQDNNYADPCPKSDNCSGTIPCYCLIG